MTTTHDDDRCFLNDHTWDEYFAMVQRHIAEHGQHLVCVGGQYTYTVGLSPAFGFELVVYGLAPRMAGAILNDIGESLRAGQELEIDKPDSRFTNLPVQFKRCTEQAQEINGIARAYFGGDVPMVQIVLCDRAGKFPDDAGFDHVHMRAQPALYRAAH